jgi:Spy/CpxP family protein refolding chaperone
MPKRLPSMLALVAAIWAAGAARAYAGGPHGMHPGPPMFGGGMMGAEGPGMVLPMILKHANLTPEQETQVRQIVDSDRQQIHSLFDQLHTANDDLVNKLLTPGPMQAQDLTPQVQKIAQLRQQLMDQGLKSALAIRAVLTPDQLTKVGQIKDQMQKLHTEMRNLMESD